MLKIPPRRRADMQSLDRSKLGSRSESAQRYALLDKSRVISPDDTVCRSWILQKVPS